MTEALGDPCLLSVTAWNVGGFPHTLGGDEMLLLGTKPDKGKSQNLELRKEY